MKRVLVARRENAIVNRLNKTKVERKPDLQQERDEHLKELQKRERIAQQEKVGLTVTLARRPPYRLLPCPNASLHSPPT